MSTQAINFPTLYAKDKAGRTQVWNVWVVEDTIYVSYGLEGGKMTTKFTVAKPKNVGKANETTPEAQAVLESQSKWLAQRERKGYVENIDDWGLEFRPMLAKDARKHYDTLQRYCAKKGITKVYTQPKLNGLRAYTSDGNIIHSRRGKEYQGPTEYLRNTLSTYKEALCAKLGVNSVFVDFELYIHGGVSLQVLNSIAKKFKDYNTYKAECAEEGIVPLSRDQAPISENLEAWVFDIYAPEAPHLTFVERAKAIMAVHEEDAEWGYFDSLIIPVANGEAEEVNNLEHLVQHRTDLMELGFEGVMIRTDEPYEVSHRSSTLWKFKAFEDDEFEVVDIVEVEPYVIPYTGEMVSQGVPLVRLGGDKTFKAPMEGDVVLRHRLLVYKAQYISKWLNVQYQEKSDDGVPLFPIGKYFRDIED